jgi:hypothetical protein
VERHVDLWTKLLSVHSVDSVDDRGPRPVRGARASVRAGVERAGQRQRIDMTRPATIAPKPMAKFHADSDTMSGIRSPAT